MDAMVRRMVDLAAGLELEHLPEAAVHAAKARLIDSMGVAIAALDAPPVRAARRLAQPTTGRYRSRLVGTGTATTPDMAAFVHGIMVRYLDFNDAYRTLDASHPSDNLPGVLAMTEALGGGGRDFILALAITWIGRRRKRGGDSPRHVRRPRFENTGRVIEPVAPPPGGREPRTGFRSRTRAFGVTLFALHASVSHRPAHRPGWKMYGV